MSSFIACSVEFAELFGPIKGISNSNSFDFLFHFFSSYLLSLIFSITKYPLSFLAT